MSRSTPPCISPRLSGVRYCVTVLAIGLTLALLARESRAQEARIWTHKTGAKAKCVLESQDETHCNLRVVDGKNTGKVVTFPKHHLSEDDQNYLVAVELSEQDQAQWERVEELIPLIYSNPKQAEPALIDFHNVHKESPYAGLLASVAACLGSNDFGKGFAILREVISRINDQREYRPGVHAVTLASCLNNQAICRIKQHKADGAAKLFLDASNEFALPVIGFNCQMLVGVAAVERSLLELTSRNRKALSTEIPGSPYQGGLREGYYFSLRIEEPTATQGNLATTRTLAVKSDFTGRSIAASGSGFVIAPEWLVTSRSVVEHDQLQTPTIGIMESAATNPKKVAADQVIVSANAGFDLAMLHIPGLNAKPIPMNPSSPAAGSDVRLVGFSDQSQFQLVENLGAVNHANSANPFFQIGVAGEKGMGGSPAIDPSGQWVGLAADVSKNKPVELLESSYVDSFVNAMNPPVVPVTITPTGTAPGTPDWKKITGLVSPSVFPVIVYADAADISRMRPGQSYANNGAAVNPETEKIVRDGWCVACEGTSRVRCLGGCSNGSVSVYKPVMVGRKLSGAPIMANKPFPTRCGACRGAGSFDCKLCKNGHI